MSEYTPPPGIFRGMIVESMRESSTQTDERARDLIAEDVGRMFDRLIEKVEAEAKAEAYNDSRHTMQLSLDVALRKVRAEAWDEGYEAGTDDESAHARGVTDAELSQNTKNPYKEESK